jgi:phage FluMu gp28-like protein
MCVKARQTGYSFVNALEAVLGCFAGTDQLIVSTSERQAKEVIEKGLRIGGLLMGFPGDPPARITSDSKTEIRFSNGHKILSLPQNPDTVRGFSGDVCLDEFAHYRQDKEIYRAIYPTTTRGYSLRIFSTPLGQSGKFFDLWNKDSTISRTKIDIEEAKRQGLVVDIEEIRREYDDEEGFQQEFMCQFIDEQTSFFPYELLRSCLGDDVGEGPAYLGCDIGRKRDRTIIYVLADVGGRLLTRRHEELKGQTFETQRSALRSIIQAENVMRGCIDATGLGMQLAEELKTEFGFIEPVTFTLEAKERMAVLAKRKFEAKQIQIPDHPHLINDLHSIRKTVTPSNNVRFDAERDSSGHADRAWALMLAVSAQTSDVGKVLFTA